MVFIEKNGFDIETNLTSVDPESIDLKSVTTDPLSTLSFEYYDVGSANPLNIGDKITVWDETGTSSRIAQPTRNFLINTLLYSPGSSTPPNVWTLSNALATSPLSYAILSSAYGMKATFSNVTYSGGNNYAQIYQDAGNTYFQKVYPGQTYYAYVIVSGFSGTISNIQAFIGIQFADVSHTLLGSQTTTYVTPTANTSQTISVSGVAPANAAYVRVLVGARATVSGSNNGTIYYALNSSGGGHTGYGGVNVEPALFPGRNMADGTPIKYPSPDCTTLDTDCTFMPDQTTVRTRFLFNGYIKNLKADYDGTNRRYEVDCLPLGDVIDNGALVTGVYPSVAVPTPTDQSIINDLVSTYFSTSLYTAQSNIWEPSTTVQFGQAISSVSFVDEPFRSVLNTLSDATGFIYYVDEYNYLWYNDTPFNYATIGINVENADYVTQFPPENYLAEQDGSQLTNSVKVLGGQFYTIETDVFSGTGSTTSFPLASKPQNIANITVGGSTYAPTSSNKVGVKGQDTLGSGGIVVLSDPNSSTVQFQIAPASGSNNVLITYPTYRNVSVLVEDNQSVAKYGRRFCSKVTDTSITDSATAQTRGIAEISKYSEPIDILTFDLTSSGSSTSLYIPRGMTVIVNSALDGFVGQPFTVTQVEVKSKGAGVNVYSYTCGIYRPSMTDAMRHTATALQSDTANGSTTILLTIEMLQENLYYSESMTSTLSGTGPYLYDTAIYGFSVYA